MFSPFQAPLGGSQLIGACPDVVSGYNPSFRFLGTWTGGVIFPGDIEHIIWRTKRFSRSGTPGEAKSWASGSSGLPSFLAGITRLRTLPDPQERLVLMQG